MRKLILIIGVFLGIALTVANYAHAVGTPIYTFGGGTGSTSPSGLLYGDNGATNHLNTVTIGSGLTFVGGMLSSTVIDTVGNWFVPQSGGNGTSTTLIFNQGFISTASSTFSNLGTGAVYTQNGLLLSHATTSTSVAYQDVWRDGNANVLANNFIPSVTSTVSSGGTVVMTPASTRYQILTGSSAHTYQMPNGNASGMNTGATWDFNNNSTGLLTVTTHAGVVIVTVPNGGFARVILTDNGTSEGSWEEHPYLDHRDVAGLYITGFGTTTPYARLSVHANAGDPNTTLFAIGSSTASATTTLFSISNTGALFVSGSTTVGSIFQGGGLTTCTGTSALTYNGTAFTCTAQPQGTVTSVSGTANQITSTGGATPVLSLPNHVIFPGNFQATNSTTTNATTTGSVYFTGVTASKILQLDANNKVVPLTVGSGLSFDGTTLTATGGGTYPFTPTSNYGITMSATSTALWGRAGLYASSTSAFDQINVGSTTSGTMATSTFYGNLNVAGMASTTQLLLGKGTSAQLALAISGDTNTGFYSSSAGSVSFVSSGNAVFNISGGNNFHLTQNGTAANPIITMASGNSGIFNPGSDNIALSIAGVEGFRIKPGIYTGFGTTTPQYLLQLATSTAPQLVISDGGNTNSYSFRDTGNNFFLSTTSPTTFATSTIPSLAIIDGGVAGKVGIASSSPYALFAIDVRSIVSGWLFAIGSATQTFLHTTWGGQTTTCETKVATSSVTTIDWQGTCNKVIVGLGSAAMTIQFINATTSQEVGGQKVIIVTNPTGTAGAVTWKDIEWSGATVPTQTTAANQADVVSVFVTSATSTTSGTTASYKMFGAQSSGFK